MQPFQKSLTKTVKRYLVYNGNLEEIDTVFTDNNNIPLTKKVIEDSFVKVLKLSDYKRDIRTLTLKLIHLENEIKRRHSNPEIPITEPNRTIGFSRPSTTDQQFKNPLTTEQKFDNQDFFYRLQELEAEVKEAIDSLPKEVIGTDEKMISANKLKQKLGIKDGT